MNPTAFFGPRDARLLGVDHELRRSHAGPGEHAQPGDHEGADAVPRGAPPRHRFRRRRLRRRSRSSRWRFSRLVASGGSPAVHRKDALAWPERRRAWAGEADEADDPAALATERLEQFEHAVVGGAGLTGQRPRDHVGEVVVADRDGIGIAERRPEHRPDRPRADAADQRQTGGDHAGTGRGPVPQVVGVRRDLGERPRPLGLDAERVEPPCRAPGEGLGGGRQAQAGERARRGGAELEAQPSPLTRSPRRR